MNNKVRNIHKRFRQGRVTYKKLKTVVNEEIANHMKDMQLLADKFKAPMEAFDKVSEPEEHVHDDNCHHFIKHGEPEAHIHNADCDHEHQ